MASFVEQYQKLYEQALEAQKKNAKNKKATTSDPKSQLGQKATPTTTNKTSTNKTVSTKNSSVTKSDVNKIVANAKVAQPNYKKFTKSQTEAILEKGKKALADREKDFNEWYTEDKKDMLFNADGTYRDLRTELDEFKAKSNTWKMTAKERHEYNTYKKELETAIEHSDYLQSRDKEKTLSTAEEKKDFYLMQDAYYDTFGEKAAMKIGKVGAGILNMPFQVADVVNDFVNPNFDINDPNNISNQITSAVNRAEEESQYNTSDAEQLGLSLTEVVADYTAHALLSIVTKIPLTVSMGAKSGLSKYAQNRAEGYDEQTSLGNATLTAIMTGLTEKLPFDNVKNIASSKLGQFSIGAILSQGISESLEEGAEYGIEPIIDFATLGKRPDYKAGELFEVMALGFLSGDIIGAGANTISVVRTRKGANKLKADMQTLTDYASSNELTDTEKIAVNDVLVLGNKALSNFEDKSILGDAVQFGSDKVQKRSVAEIMQNFNSFLQPQIDAEAKTYKERAALNNIVNNAQQVLLNKGIQMDAVQYSSLNEDVKKQVDTLQGLARDLKQDVVFNSELTAKGKTIDGYYNNKTGRIVINPLGENPAMSTFVHELTHGTESSKLYNRLKELVFASNENFKEEVQNVKDRYKSVTDLTDEGAEQEYVAIYLQEKLGNEDFVKRLVKYDTSLAARIYEGVKKVVFNTKTSQDVEYAFMKAFRDSGINEQDVKQYAIGKTMDGIDVALADNAISKKEALNLKKVKQYLQNNIGKTFEIKSDGTIVDYTNYDVNEYLYSKYAQNLSKKNINKLIVKNRIVTDLGEIIEVSRNPNFQTNKNNKVHQSDPDIGKKGFTHYETTFGVPVKDANGNIEDYNIYEGELIVEHNNNNSSTMYDIINIKKSNRKLDPSTIGTSSMFGANSTLPTASKNNISNNATNVNNSTNNSDRSFSIGISTQDVKGRTLSKQQQEYFKNSKARDENGNLKVYYHGTSRADRVGTVFDPERATSGPMAYFTDNEQIASNYARDKRDTSIAYDERYDSYYTQFRINHNGEDISVTDYWNTLPLAKRREITEKAKHITMDDDWENVVYDEDVNNGLGNMDQHLLREHNGNAISALISSWLQDGNIYGEESKFLDVLDLIGIENAQYLDPNYRDEKVYETYLNITNPLDTSELDVGFVDDLEYWINNNDMTPYQKESSGADTWDKNNWNLNEWVDKLRDDVENGTTHAWTSIPDAVTAYLKEQGYDGISDTGGKNGGTTHQVMIPFDSNQVKNVDNSTPTTNRDIRYSIGLTKDGLNRPNKYQKKFQELNKQMEELDLIDDMESLENYLDKYYTEKHRSIRYDANLNELLDYGFDEDLLDEFKWNENHYYEDDIEDYKREAQRLEKRYVALEEPLETDNAGKRLSKEQKEFFKNVNIYSRDKEGHLKRFYHGTPEGGFYTFELGEKRHGRALGDGFYFSDSRGMASEYLGKSNDSKLYEVYLKMENTLSGDTYNGELQDKALDIIHKYYSPNIDENHPYYYYVLEKLYSVPGVIDYFKGLAEFNKIPFGDLMKEYGYDSVNSYNEFVVFDSEQIKDINNTNPTANKDIRYSVGLNSKDLHDQAIDEYGAFEKGEIPVRDVEIAKETDYGKTNRFARTIAESSSFNDEQVDLLKSKIGEGEFAYESLSNKKLQDDATFKIEKVGLEKSIENYLLEEGYSSKSIAEGEILLDTVARSGDNDMAIKLASKLSMQLTEAGRAVQAARLLKRLTPQGQLVVAERTIAKLQKSLDKRYGEKSPNLEINEELKTKLLNSKNETEMYQALDEISVEVGKQIPSTLMDKLNTWRYLAMLGNPRTHVRNVLGNAMFYPLVTMKNNIGTVLEASAKKVGKLDTRTKSVLNPFDAKDKALIEFGKENFAECKQLFEKAGKYDLSDLIEQNREVYSNDKAFGRTLNKLVKTNSDALEWGDVVFSKQRYASSLAQYMKANGLTQNDVGKKEFVRAQEYAYKEATKQTYRDASTLATAAEKLAKTNKVTQLAVDAILPFKKTPMNVLSRGVEYSPIGLISTVTKGSMELKKGNITANEFIDSMSAGLTGTGVTLLGAFLASVGAFRTRDDDKDRKQQMDNDLGEQDYALVFPHGTYTIDWASPMIMPLAIGAELFNGIDSFKNIDDLVTVASKITEPIFETSMLSGVASTFQSYESGQKGVFNMIQNAITSYVNQYFPTLFGQVARSIDDTRRTTYPNTGTIDKTGKQILNKIPGLSYLNEPYINKKGEEQKQEGSNVFSRMFLNMLSPGYYKSKTIDKYDEELLRLYNDDVSNIGVLPSSSTNKVTYEKETYKLLDEDYTKFNQTRYSLEREYTDGFIDSDIYNTLTDSERVSIISKMREYAGKEAKNQYLIGIGKTYDDSEYTKVKGALDTGIELYEYYLTKSYYNSLSGKTKKSEYVDYLINSGYSAEEMTYLYDMIYSDGKLEGHVANASLSDEELKSKAYAKAMSKSKKSSTSSKYKKVDEIVNKVRKSSSSSGDSKVDEILKKLKNASSSGDSSLNTSNSSLLKRYLKEHAYDAAKFK